MALYSSALVPNNIDPVPSSNSAVQTIFIGTSALSLLAANPNRKGFSIYNNSTRTIYVSVSLTVTTTVGFFALLPPNSLFEWSLASIYTGAIFAIANGASANCQVTEFTA